MKTLGPSSDDHVQHSARVNVVVSILRAVVYALRLVIFAPLAIFEPVIRIILAGTCLVGLSACLFYKLADPSGAHHVHYGVLITVSLVAAVTLALYYKFMRWLAP
jgi:hypothetical protein